MTTSIPLVGATVKILDGPSAQQAVVTDSAGKYAFNGLPQAGFNVQVSAPGYTSQSMGVNLATDLVQDFLLVQSATPNLQGVGGSVTPERTPDNQWTYTIPAINVGDGCAGVVSGIVTFSDANDHQIATASWALPTAVIIQPGQQFIFNVTIGNDAALSSRSYSTFFLYVYVPCR